MHLYKLLFKNHNFILPLYLLIFAILICFPSMPCSQEKTPSFIVDFAQFKLDKKQVCCEVYYSILKENLTYKVNGDSIYAKALIMTYIVKNDDEEDSLVYFDPKEKQLLSVKGNAKFLLIDSLLITDSMNFPKQISAWETIEELSRTEFKQDSYLFLSILTDLTTQKTAKFREVINIEAYRGDDLMMSDLQLASALRFGERQKSKFNKYGFQVFPNAACGYNEGASELFFYLEIYNLKSNTIQADSTFTFQCSILDHRGTMIIDDLEKGKIIDSNLLAIAHSVNIENLKSGFYTLKVTISNNSKTKSVERRKNFFIRKSENLIELLNQEN